MTYTYDAWGKVTSVTGTDAETVGKYNSLRYRGYYYDNETGYYYLQSRYYDPGYKRFINADEPKLITDLTKESVLGGNLFAYCQNNAVNDSDPSGEGAAVIVALGLQIEISIGGFSVGMEIIWSYYCDNYYFYFYKSGNASMDLFANIHSVVKYGIKNINAKKLKVFFVDHYPHRCAFFWCLIVKEALVLKNTQEMAVEQRHIMQ